MRLSMVPALQDGEVTEQRAKLVRQPVATDSDGHEADDGDAQKQVAAKAQAPPGMQFNQ